jgi:hypothetical protein
MALRLDATLACSIERHADPTGATLHCEVGDAPTPDAREALLDELEATLVGERGNLVSQAIRVSHGALRSYGDRNDYHVDPIAESVRVERDRSAQDLTVRWHWDHEAAKWFNWGVSPHTIDGDPLLSFIWEDAPKGVREMFPHTERVGGDPRVFLKSVDHPGLPAAHFLRAGTRWLRSELQD